MRGVLALAAGAVACSASTGSNSEVGTYATGGRAGAGGAPSMPDTGGGTGVIGNGGANSNALRVHVENPQKLTIDTVTLRCAGDCADIQAVARGGNPPYTFAWEDGTTTDTRHVCLDASAALTVTARDTERKNGEFPYEAQTATATVTANVLGCRAGDAGPRADAAPPAGGPFCVANPGFETSPPGTSGPGIWNLPGWTVCEPSPDVGPRGDIGSPPATEGATYFLGFSTVGFGSPPESAAAAFCQPLLPGKAVAFLVDVSAAITTSVFAPGGGKGGDVLELWGGMTSCATDELLWRSPPLPIDRTWKTYCVTVVPSKAYAYLRLLPTDPGGDDTGGTAFIMVDNFRSVTSCL